MNNLLYSWNFSTKKNRWQLWYIIVISISIWLIIWWFLTKQYWMSFVIILLLWLGYFAENNSEDNLYIELLNSWIKIWNDFHDYPKFSAFSIIYDWEEPVFLRLHKKKAWWLKYIELDINKSISNNIRSILITVLEEAWEEELTMSDKMIRLLKL
jgi:hypothetical protein